MFMAVILKKNLIALKGDGLYCWWATRSKNVIYGGYSMHSTRMFSPSTGQCDTLGMDYTNVGTVGTKSRLENVCRVHLCIC